MCFVVGEVDVFKMGDVVGMFYWFVVFLFIVLVVLFVGVWVIL